MQCVYNDTSKDFLGRKLLAGAAPMLAVTQRRLKENYYNVTERHIMDVEHGGSQGVFHSAYCYIPLQAPLAHINLIKTWFKPISCDAKRKKGRVRFTTLLQSFHHYSCCTVILVLTTMLLILLSSANVWEFSSFCAQVTALF
jgi:hypothetical protein